MHRYGCWIHTNFSSLESLITKPRNIHLPNNNNLFENQQQISGLMYVITPYSDVHEFKIRKKSDFFFDLRKIFKNYFVEPFRIFSQFVFLLGPLETKYFYFPNKQWLNFIEPIFSLSIYDIFNSRCHDSM